jgi:hypothetical protein
MEITYNSSVWKYRVLSAPVLSNNVFTMDVDLFDTEGAFGSGQGCTIRNISEGGVLTDYVVITDYWLSNGPTWATTVEGIIYTDPATRVVTDNAYVGDMDFQPVLYSTDWDVVSYTNNATNTTTSLTTKNFYVTATDLQASSTTPPTWTQFKPTGASGFGVSLPAFSHNLSQYAGLSLPVPSDWALNSSITPHIHFTINSAMSAGETVTFGFEYTIAREGDVFGTTQNITATYTATGAEVAGQNIALSWAPVSVPGTADKPPHISGTLYRDNTDTFINDAFFINFGVRYTASN